MDDRVAEAQQYSMSSRPSACRAGPRARWPRDKSRHRDGLFGAHHLPVGAEGWKRRPSRRRTNGSETLRSLVRVIQTHANDFQKAHRCSVLSELACTSRTSRPSPAANRSRVKRLSKRCRNNITILVDDDFQHALPFPQLPPRRPRRQNPARQRLIQRLPGQQTRLHRLDRRSASRHRRRPGIGHCW